MPNEADTCSIEKLRLLELIEFAQHAAKLRTTPAHSIAQHRGFALYEHQVSGLPGIKLNINGAESEDEIWLVVERLHERKPPEIDNPVLLPWVQLPQSPFEEPRLLGITNGINLIAAGTHRSTAKVQPNEEENRKPPIEQDIAISLDDYDKAMEVKSHFAAYLTKWRPWAEEEKLRRETIQHYAKLYTLKQQLEGGLVEAQLELVWGVGFGIWNCSGAEVAYPLVGRLVELALNAETAAIEIRPRDVEPRIEVDWYASVDNPGVTDLEKAAKKFFGEADRTFSPFDRGTFEPLLRSATTFLGVNGIYWPDQVRPENRSLPKADTNLKITDTWVLFARPRTSNLFVQDLEKLKKAAEKIEPGQYPPAVTAILTDPSTDNPPVELPAFRGLSATYHTQDGVATSKARDLYFPKPFNDEQVRIVQLLAVSEGVVVQGPPGTGKTHTIANVICHYLANGKRVLVTSMKDPALAVLQEQLPEEIRPLAISLLTSERDGMRQFEHAIHKIASEVQALDRTGTARDIRRIDESIDALHGRLALIDRRIGEWALKNLVKVSLDGEEIEPQDAARQVVESLGQFEWIPDTLGVGPEFAPQFSDTDVVQLREARRQLAQDIDYLDASLPQVAEFPDLRSLLQAHQDLSHLELLKQGIESGEVPELADSSQGMLDRANGLLQLINELQRLRKELMGAHQPWIGLMKERIRNGDGNDRLRMLEALGRALEGATEQRRRFIQRPVTAPSDAETDTELLGAVQNLAAGKRPFGFAGFFGKAREKKRLDSIRVGIAKPGTKEEWKHVADYLSHLGKLSELALRWNTLANEIPMEAVPGTSPEDGLSAAKLFAVYLTLKKIVAVETELCSDAASVFPGWPHSREAVENPERLAELERALYHHLTKNRLAAIWATKENFQKVLEGRSGRIIDDIRSFLTRTLGDPNIADAEMQGTWSFLMSELSRVLRLASHLEIVRDVCDQVKASGAPHYAESLKAPISGTVDVLLPDNWRQAWRLKRLVAYLDSIDARDEMKKLAKDRHDAANDLSRAYRDVVVKRTWLQLAENASPKVKAALQAYLTAIQRIGKGTGKRAVRFRQDAREATSQANPAVPCWIMPHYRVSESLPPELGCFDLVVIDEASQSDLTALPALLRAQKVLIVGDDKQVSPDVVGLAVEQVNSLMNRFLGNQVKIFRAQMDPAHSIYDLFKVAFAMSAVMLKEHFRCVGPIIEYSKREFYNHELRPLRLSKASERLDPPLVDVLIEDGYRKGDLNLPEARFIVGEIKRIAEDPNMRHRSVGVVSLLADEQAKKIWDWLTVELGPDIMERHRIACGDARTFQGKERDIMFLSMVVDPKDCKANTAKGFEQRFNVAASRARDRMYLIRSVEISDLSPADGLRRGLLSHFAAPFAQNEARVVNLRELCESDFEREMYDELSQRGYSITPQVRVGHYRIDMVAEGHNDARLAIECDGDKYHGADQWPDDMQRQRVLERAGWVFWRCFASAFTRRRKEVLEDLLKTLAQRGIEPIGAEGAPRSIHTEHRRVNFSTKQEDESPVATQSAQEVQEAPNAPPPPPAPKLSSPPTSINANPRLGRILNTDVLKLQSSVIWRAGNAPVLPLAPTPESKREAPPDVPSVSGPSDKAVADYCQQYGIGLKDHRAKGGALWALHLGAGDEKARQLIRWGFKWAENKGYWKK